MDIQDDEQEKIIDILNQIEPIVKCGNLEAFKDLIQAMHDVRDKILLSSCYNNRNIDLISLICERTNRKLLNYLLHRSHILHYLISDDRSKERKYKETAFYFAMRSNNFEILEMLYDYWTGDLHWLGHKKEYDEFDVDNLNQLHDLLVHAFHKYELLIKKKQKVDRTMILSIHSLMAFNNFQRYIYKKLNELKRTLVTWENETKNKTKHTVETSENETKHKIRIKETNVIRTMILTIINAYEQHKNVVLQLQTGENIENLDDLVDGNLDNSEDEPVNLEESYFYATYEVYYRKLDYNICLLILDHLYLLKLRLSMPQDSYQKLENKLYHFYQHISNNWRLYLPKRKKMVTCNILGKYKSILCHYRLNYNSKKLLNANYIMYYERRDFVKTIKTFKKELKNRPIEENIRKEKSKLHHDDHNYLKLVPELRDDYSLKMMTQLIGQLHSVNVNTEYAVLLVQRTLQVVGEFLKSTNESLHLEPSTEALLKVEMSVEIINDLKKLRDMLSHAKKGILLKRIELEKDNFNIFKAIRNELLQVKRKIDKVIKVHKPLVQRALLLNTMSILCERRNELFAAAGKDFLYMLTLLKYIFTDDYGQFYEKISPPLSFLKSICEELLTILVTYLHLHSKLTRVSETIHNNVISEFPFYRKMIEYSLNVMTEDKKKWLEIVEAIKDKDSSANLSNYPNEADANRIKSYLKKFDLGDENNEYLEEDGTLFAHIEHHWRFIENLLEFIIVKTGIFEDTDEGSQVFISLKELKEYDYKANDVKLIVTEYLDKIEKRLPKNKNTTNMNLQVHEQPPEFNGIKEFSNKLSKPNFLIKEEKRLLIDTLQSICTNSKKKLATRSNMLKKIEEEIAISMTTYRNFITSEQLNGKVQKILKNLVKGYPRDPLILHCLNNRISVLKAVTTNLTVNQLVSRYKLDKTFRVLLEILLFDVFDILEGNNKNTEMVKKSSKLLMEINLRNILTHGSPLLDVVGVVIDSNDLPTELISKALEFVKDKRSIEALCSLRDSGYFSPNNNITAEQQSWMNTFIKSPRWKDYIQLVPEYKQLKYERSDKIIDKDTKLIEEVQGKDYLSVLLSIDRGADVNFIDTYKKAAIHYAAVEGDIYILTMLVNNGADINIRNEETNMTALHYSTMHNSKDAVEFLLKNKADCLVMDSKGRTPAYLANQKEFLDISKVLIREMKKCEMIV